MTRYLIQYIPFLVEFLIVGLTIQFSIVLEDYAGYFIIGGLILLVRAFQSGHKLAKLFKSDQERISEEINKEKTIQEYIDDSIYS